MQTLLVSLLALATATPAGADEVIARIDGRPVTAAALQARLATSRGQPPIAVLDDLLNDNVLALAAERQGLASDPGAAKEIEAQRRRLAAERFIEKELYPAAQVDEGAVREMFHAQADTVRLNLIVLVGEADAKAAQARLAKTHGWAEEARASLEARGRAAGGDAGEQSRGQLDPALAKAAFAAPPGVVSGPVQLALGWAVFEVVARDVAPESAFAERRAALMAFGRDAARQQVKQHYVRTLRKEAGLELDEKFVESTGTRLDATPDEQAHVLGRYWGKPITYGDTLPEIRSLAGNLQGGHFSGPRVKLEVINQRANQLVLEEAAIRRGHDKGAEPEAALEPFRRDALARAYSSRLRSEVAAATDAEVDAEYRARAAELRRPGHRTCSQVLSDSKGMAEKARDRIRRGEKLAEVARDASTDPAGAAAGGLIGEIADDRLDGLAGSEPELANAIRSAKPDALAGPVKSRMGWHVLSCGPYQGPTAIPVAEVAPALRAVVAQRHGDDAVRRRIAELRGRAKVELVEAAVARATSPVK